MSATFDQVPGITHPIRVDTPDRFISITRARLIARYRMHTIAGRPEELETNQVFVVTAGTGEDRLFSEQRRVVSFAFSGGEMRIRKHGGPDNRDWIEVRDFQLRDGWLSEVYDFLDTWMRYASPRTVSLDVQAVRPRPIRDNPQA